jgi:hypothetical protein
LRLVRSHSTAAHKFIYPSCAVKYRLDIGCNRLMLIETIVKPFHLPIELFDESINIVFAMSAVESAPVECPVQGAAKLARLLFYAMKYSLNFLVTEPVR